MVKSQSFVHFLKPSRTPIRYSGTRTPMLCPMRMARRTIATSLATPTSPRQHPPRLSDERQRASFDHFVAARSRNRPSVSVLRESRRRSQRLIRDATRCSCSHCSRDVHARWTVLACTAGYVLLYIRSEQAAQLTERTRTRTRTPVGGGIRLRIVSPTWKRASPFEVWMRMDHSD